MVSVAVFVVSALDVAVKVAVLAVVTLLGALYVVDDDVEVLRVPAPERLQATP